MRDSDWRCQHPANVSFPQLGITWYLGDLTRQYDITAWARKLTADEIVKVRLCYSKHKRHRVAHEVVAGPGYRQMSIVLWLKILVMLRVRHGEKLTVNSPILVLMNRKKLVPMTGDFMRRMDKIYAPRLGCQKATLHSRRRGFATAAVKSGIHMANITIAMRHSQGVTMQYVSLSIEEKAIITTRLAIAAYKGEPKGGIARAVQDGCIATPRSRKRLPEFAG